MVRIPAQGGEEFKVGKYTYEAIKKRKDAISMLLSAL